MKRAGVIGTMVWDTIVGRGPEALTPVDEWGGIAYALAALEASLPPDWALVPLVKVGRDLAPQANRFLRDLTRRAAAARFVEVAEPNNRVTLRYADGNRRSERLTGGVPPWTWAELGPMVRDLDAIYVNFISGWELDLATAGQLRRGFAGPVYADLHSLFLSVGWGGLRQPRHLPDPAEAWFECFDVVQVNEAEMALMGDDPMAVAAAAVRAGVRLLVVTLAARGAVYFTVEPFRFFPRPGGRPEGPIRTARVAAPAIPALDPTGCGDVFGATLFARLLGGDALAPALAGANDAAARNVAFRGASGLHVHLRGAILPG